MNLYLLHPLQQVQLCHVEIRATHRPICLKGHKIMKIQNATALVTGANRGIGYAFVKALLQAGVKKGYATARDVSSLEAVTALDANRVIFISTFACNTL